ncbi:hypothetical protein BASA81_009246 [Batrachochytrium salamandrivorans]|nr:hypothetical protein BASA81_009246 [Batrachochytrium salamandrivorans]
MLSNVQLEWNGSREVGGICVKEPVSPRGANTTSVPLTPIPRALLSPLQFSNLSPSSMFIMSVLRASGGRSFTAESKSLLRVGRDRFPKLQCCGLPFQWLGLVAEA